MKIIIKETGVQDFLSIIDPNTGVNWIADFVGNTGATQDGQFVWVDELDAYICDQDTYDWWGNCVSGHQKLSDRIHELELEHGWEAVQDAIAGAYNCDLGDQPNCVNGALDEIFGS